MTSRAVAEYSRFHIGVYVANAALLMCHEIDSAYWREWELFHLPGGNAGFVLIHVPLAVAVLGGLVLLCGNRRAGRWFSLALALAGVAGASVHAYFLSQGDDRFRAPVSIGLIVAFASTSLVQLVVAARERLAPAAPPGQIV